MFAAHTIRTWTGALLTISVIAVLCAPAAHSVPPHPDAVAELEAGTKTAPWYLQNLGELRAKGIGTGLTMRPDNNGAVKLVPGKAPTQSSSFRALAVLIDFSDNPSQVASTYFDSLMFDSVGTSVRDYYDEISYGQLDIVTANLPSSLGWQRAPQTYAYYVDGQNGTGTYPQNTQGLCVDIVDQIDPVVDFSNYDNDGDGYVDVLILIHAGTGAEKTLSNDDIWSHKWAIAPRSRDGVYISDYTIQPELWVVPGDMTIGVYAHELGHGFGLPDLYDTDATQSHAIGIWGIMAYGSWLGPGNNGGSPAHPCAWSRIQLGFATATNVTLNTNAQTINQVETSGEIYRLWTSGAAGDEYFLVENRQRTGYDSHLYSSGLLVWHIDDAKATGDNSDNTQEWWPGAGMNAAEHYRVALEQADGLWELEKKTDYGDAGDPFPGATAATVFDATTTPTSDAYTAGTSFVKIDNISASGPTMSADLIVSFAAGTDPDTDPLVPQTISLDQNYPNPFNPSTTVSFEVINATRARVDVFDVLGRKVRTLLDDWVESGQTSVNWNGRNADGNIVAAGVYLYRLTTQSGLTETRKMVMVK